MRIVTFVVTESVDHLFSDFSLAKRICQVVTCAFNLVMPPEGVDGMTGAWLHFFPRNQRHLVLRGRVTMYWTIWKARNSDCFDKKKNP